MKWVKINFCINSSCNNSEHRILDDKRICDLSSIPTEWDNYLVSDGKIIDIAEYGYTFHNWLERNRKLKNKDIKYWASLKEIKLPDES